MYWIYSIFSSQQVFRRLPLLSNAFPDFSATLAELWLFVYTDPICKIYESHGGLQMAINNQNLKQNSPMQLQTE